LSTPPHPVRPRYRLYLDESGDHTYNLLDDPSHRFLALLGVWFRLGIEYNLFSQDMEEFKREIFGYRADRQVILHRTDIINRRGPFGRLREPEIEARFNEGLLELIRAAPFTMICVILDKQRHLAKYSNPFHPYHYCLTAILDRYCSWLNDRRAVGDVMGESRGRIEDQQLRKAYLGVYENGTILFHYPHHQRVLTSNDMRLQPKVANVAGLQLADILAHPVKQECLVERGLIPDLGAVFGRRVYEAVEDKLNCGWGGRVESYGKVFLPRI
jgi:hypothetical protein